MTGEIKLTVERRPSTRPDVLTEAVSRLWLENASAIETVYRMCVRPKPAWLPARAWRWVLRHVVFQEVERKHDGH